MQKIVILGAGGFAREVLDIFIAQNRIDPQYEILGFIDENPERWGQVLNGFPILGGFEWFDAQPFDHIRVICGVGSPQIRKKLVEKAYARGLKFCNIVHPTSVLTSFVTLGEGVVITAGCILTNNIRIGNHVHLNLDTTVGHDCVIEDYCTISPGVHISGNVHIQTGAYIGTGAAIIERITIGAWSVIGAGAVVIRDIPPNVTAVGVPAKPVKSVKHEREL